MDKTPEQIAAGLTKVQQREICGEMRSIGNPPHWFLCGDWINFDRRSIPTMAALTRAGLLADGRFGPTVLTPLGLAVRAILQQENTNAD